MTDTLTAIICDFDGVLVDSEPLHCQGLIRVLADQGLTVTAQDYYRRYLGFDDRGAFAAAGRDHGRQFDDSQMARMIADKNAWVCRQMSQSIAPLDGAVEFIAQAARRQIPLAICSGALRNEIELASQAVGIRRHISVIVAAEDVSHGKPDPMGYRLTIERLSALLGRPVDPARCVVVEDSPAGIAAAKAAEAKVLAVATSHPPHELTAADRIALSLAQVDIQTLHELTARPPAR